MVSVQKDQRNQELSLHVLTDLNSQQNERVTGSQKKLHADAVDVTKYPKL